MFEWLKTRCIGLWDWVRGKEPEPVPTPPERLAEARAAREEMDATMRRALPQPLLFTPVATWQERARRRGEVIGRSEGI